MPIRQPIVVVLGHVDHGKTTLLDKVRGTSVAAREPGAISQHIGASFVPAKVITKICGNLLDHFKFKVEIPGLLFVDTPGHAAFSNLRKRGGSVADIAILVVSLMEGVKPQTAESINILKTRKTPFVVAANKLDLIHGWRSHPNGAFLDSWKSAESSLARKIDERVYSIVGGLSSYKLNADRFDRIRDFAKSIAVIPVSAVTGEGLPDLFTVLVGLTQQYMKQQLEITAGPAKGTILEVMEDVGLGVNINAIIYDGILRMDDLLIIGGKHGPFSTRIRSILVPKPLDEIRDPREKFKKIKEVTSAAGVKIVAPGLGDAIAGSPLYATWDDTELKELTHKVKDEIESLKISTDKLGIVLKADTLGSLEALINELQANDISIRIADVGDVSKRDVVEASVVKGQEPTFGVILSFNVKILPDASEEVLKTHVKIFQNNVIYQLLDEYYSWVKSEREAKTLKSFTALVKPGKIRLIPGCVFRRSTPAVVGVEVIAGHIRPQWVLIRENASEVGRIVQIQDKGQNISEASRGMQVAISMKEPTVGRQVREGDVLYIDVPEDHIRMLKEQFQPMLTSDELECLDEFITVKRKKMPYFAFGI